MKIINNDKEFENFYYYKTATLRKGEYPKSYPCVVEQVQAGGGLAGEYVMHVVTLIPKGADLESFLLGYKAARKVS